VIELHFTLHGTELPPESIAIWIPRVRAAGISALIPFLDDHPIPRLCLGVDIGGLFFSTHLGAAILMIIRIHFPTVPASDRFIWWPFLGGFWVHSFVMSFIGFRCFFTH